MAGWADLPWDMLRLIREKLSIPDNLRIISSLCTWWKNFKEQPVPPKAEPPWLLIHPLPDNEKPNIAAFFDLSQAKILRIPVPLPPFQERICLGSTDGWMVTITRATFEAHLLNPVNRRQIVLPRFRCISAVEQNEDLNVTPLKRQDEFFAKFLVENVDRFFRYSKAVVSWDKREENAEHAFMVVIKLHFRECIIVAREGQPHWQVFQPARRYEDVMTNARGRFFFLDPIKKGVDIRQLQHQEIQLNLEHLSLQMPQDQEINLDFAYLAGWFLGEESEIFILVKTFCRRICSDKKLRVGQSHFKVFKYDDNVGCFKEVFDLGGKSIFVGASNAIVSSHPELRRNSVYHIDAFNYPNDVCIYDMEEHSFLITATGAPRREVKWLDARWLNAVGLDAVWLNPSFE